MANENKSQSKRDRGDAISRRKVLTIVGGTIAGLPLLGQAADRIYGLPTSTPRGIENYKKDDDLVRLQLVRGDIPEELWSDIISLNALVEDALKDSKNMRSFSRNPKRFLKSRGFQSEMFKADSLEMRMLQAVSDPYTNKARRSGDLQLFFRRLEEKKVFDALEVSELAKKTGKVFEKDYAMYMKILQETNLSQQGLHSMAVQATAMPVALRKKDFLKQISSPTSSPPVPSVVANIAVNVNVAVNALVAVNVAALVLVAVGVGVCGLLTAPITHTKEMQVMVNNAARATHLARLIGDREFESRVLNHFIDLHGTFIMDAMEELPFFTKMNISKDQFREFLVFSIRQQLGVALV